MSFVAADALKLPYADASFHAVTISFGLRNVEDTTAALNDAQKQQQILNMVNNHRGTTLPAEMVLSEIMLEGGQGAFYVNAARFGIAQEEPLLEALRSGRLAGAAFDHFEGEFLPDA